jgi:hypothetical protein
MTSADTIITTDVFHAAVAAAIRAPSVYNVQPWRFALRDGRIDVRIDPHRHLPIADPHQWAARIACGAAITNIHLALAAAGLDTRTELWPALDDPLLVATISPSRHCAPSPHQLALHAAIPNRHSNRRPFFDTPVPVDIRARLESAVGGGAWMILVSDRQPVARTAEIIRSADEQLRNDAAYVAEMRAWISRSHSEHAGIPADAAGTAPAAQDLLAMREFGGRERAEGRDFESDPLLAVLGTPGDNRYDQVGAGSALQRVLLTATDARLATSLLSQAIEVPAARSDLQYVLHCPGRPQMIIRIGYGQHVEASGRRPIGSVIDEPA